MGTLILIHALVSRALRGRGHVPLPHPPPWAAKAAHYFNFSHISPLIFGPDKTLTFMLTLYMFSQITGKLHDMGHDL